MENMRTKKEEGTEKVRYHLLDSIRGILLIGMMMIHFTYDMMILSDGKFIIYDNPVYRFFQSFSAGFFLISGMCNRLSKSSPKRGLMVLGGALIVSIVTYLFDSNSAISFGVLCCIGSCMLLMIPVKKVAVHMNPAVGLAVCIPIFIFLYDLQEGIISVFGIRLFEVPDFLYANYLTAYLGCPPDSFYSSDYFPLFPWFFLYLSGYFLFGCLEKKEKILDFLKHKIPVLTFLGRHSLWVYLLHQPVCYAIAIVVAKIVFRS